MCDIWRANKNKEELTMEDLESHFKDFRELNVQWVVLSGGEALMHKNLFTLCEAFKETGAKISLLSTGLLLKKHAENVVKWCDEVIVSLDGSEDVHNEIRNIPNVYAKMKEGILSVRAVKKDIRITGRCVLQKLNYKDFPNIIKAAHDLQLDEISFLGADVSTSAFNRPELWGDEKVVEVALNEEDAKAFEKIAEQTFKDYKADFDNKFVAENPDKIRKIVQHYQSLLGLAPPPEIRCNAPWVSAVIETNGDVLPCFFHKSMGNIADASITEIINSEEAVSFRKSLDIEKNPICQNCVCYLSLKPSASF